MRRAAIQLDADHYRALKLLGSALYALGDLPAAEAALKQALALHPDYADASCDLGARLRAGSGVAHASRPLDARCCARPLLPEKIDFCTSDHGRRSVCSVMTGREYFGSLKLE